ncbi:WW domain-containing protein, partial [Levilactobacillus suantsaiihabitans]
MQVKLSDIIEAIDFTDDGMTYYYNKKTGEVELVVDGMADDDAVADEIEDNFDQYLRLPSHYEINDYQKMVEFIAGLPAGKEA